MDFSGLRAPQRVCKRSHGPGAQGILHVPCSDGANCTRVITLLKGNRDSELSANRLKLYKALGMVEVGDPPKVHKGDDTQPQVEAAEAERLASEYLAQQMAATQLTSLKEPRKVCKNFLTAEGCQYGDNCNFEHRALGVGERPATPTGTRPRSPSGSLKSSVRRSSSRS